MSYNILKKNVKFSGNSSGSIENMVDNYSSQVISGSKNFQYITGSFTKFIRNVELEDNIALDMGKKIFFEGNFTGDGPYIGATSFSALTIDSDDYLNVFFDKRVKFTSGSTTYVTMETGSFDLGVPISSSTHISASKFVGDGSQLSGVGSADGVNAAGIRGALSASQITFASPLQANGTSLDVSLASNRGIVDDSGLALDIGDLSSYTGALTEGEVFLAVSGTAGTIQNKKATFEWLGDRIKTNATNIDAGTLNNARLPVNISRTSFTASDHVSASLFFGDGAGITGVTATPTPAGATTQIQFNDDSVLTGDPQLVFLTGSNTLSTTIVSASGHVSASAYGGVAGTLIDSAGNFAGNNASFAEITASSVISSSANISGNAFYGDGRELTGAPLDAGVANAVVTVVNATTKTITSNANFKYDGSDVTVANGDVKAVNFSASADLQVGGHITGSGDIILGASAAAIRFDPDASTSSTVGPLIQTNAGLSTLMVDGDTTLSLQADDNLNFRVGGSSGTGTLRAQMSAIHFSSSLNITGATFNNPQGTLIDSTGNFQGNNASFNEITASSVISSSANISGAAFYGDGSNLSGIAPSFRYYYNEASMTISDTQSKFIDWKAPSGGQLSLGSLPGGKIVAASSGSIVRMTFSPSDQSSTASDGDQLLVNVTRNAEATADNARAGGKILCQASGTFDKPLSYLANDTTTINTFTGEIDFTSNFRLTGSISFDPGDILGFAVQTPGGTINECLVSITLKYEET